MIILDEECMNVSDECSLDIKGELAEKGPGSRAPTFNPKARTPFSGNFIRSPRTFHFNKILQVNLQTLDFVP